MANIRYFLFSHSRENSPATIAIHALVGQYHWARIDEDTVLVKASYPICNHKALHERQDTTVLPSLYSSTVSIEDHIAAQSSTKEGNKLSARIQAHPHLKAFRTLMGKEEVTSNRLKADLTPEEPMTMSDFVSKAEEAFGPLFSADK